MSDLAKSITTQLNKYFKDDAAMVLGDSQSLADYRFISTGSVAVDRVCGNGIPVGHCVSIMGKPSTGKSTLTYHIISQAQKEGGLVLLVDSEHSYDVKRGQEVFGIDNSNIILCQEGCSEAAFNRIEATMKIMNQDYPETLLLVVIDSTSFLLPQRVLKGDYERDSDIPGLRAKFYRTALPKMQELWKDKNIAVVLVCQSTSKFVTFGDAETFIAEDAIMAASKINLRIRRLGIIKDGDAPIGIKSEVYGRKNKISTPFLKSEVSIFFDRGIDDFEYTLDKACELGIVVRRGGWYNYNDNKFRKDDLRQFATELYEKIGTNVVVAEEPDDDGAI